MGATVQANTVQANTVQANTVQTKTIHLGDIAIEVIYKDIQNIHLSVLPPQGHVRISAPLRMKLVSFEGANGLAIAHGVGQLKLTFDAVKLILCRMLRDVGQFMLDRTTRDNPQRSQGHRFGSGYDRIRP